MEIPHLVNEQLGEESVEATVSLGDEDLACLTPTRTLVYRAEGLLSDESVSAYPHHVERLDVSEGRRKTKFLFEYVDGTDSFTVPGDRANAVLAPLLGGVLRVAGVTVDGESVGDVFTFSELTLAVTSHRLVKHVGAPVWDEDFEEFPYADVTGLSFEEGSVATQVVLSVGGRPERIKAPSDKAWQVEEALTGALCGYHDVGSLSALNEKVAPEDAGTRGSDAGSFTLDEDISPLVGDEAEQEAASGPSPEAGSPRSAASADDSASGWESEAVSESRPGDPDGSDARESGNVSVGTAQSGERGVPAVDPEDIEVMKTQLSTLTEAVTKQNELLRDQQDLIEQLVEELRRGR